MSPHHRVLVQISGDGEVLNFLVDPDAKTIGAITAAVEHKGWLYMGSLANNFVGVIDLSKA